MPWVCTERTVSILRGVATDFGVPIEPTFSADFYITHEFGTLMLETKCVGDNFEMLMTVLAVFVTITHLSPTSTSKVGCVFPMVVVFILPQAKFRPNNHREDAFLVM